MARRHGLYEFLTIGLCGDDEKNTQSEEQSFISNSSRGETFFQGYVNPPSGLQSIPAAQIQNSNAEIPNAEIPNSKSQITISIFCRNPKSQIPNTSNLCILASQIPNYLGFGQHVYCKDAIASEKINDNIPAYTNNLILELVKADTETASKINNEINISETNKDNILDALIIAENMTYTFEEQSFISNSSRGETFFQGYVNPPSGLQKNHNLSPIFNEYPIEPKSYSQISVGGIEAILIVASTLMLSLSVYIFLTLLIIAVIWFVILRHTLGMCRKSDQLHGVWTSCKKVLLSLYQDCIVTCFFMVVGMKFRDGHKFKKSDIITLELEPSNIYDKNAIKVMVDGTHKAYVTKDENFKRVMCEKTKPPYCSKLVYLKLAGLKISDILLSAILHSCPDINFLILDRSYSFSNIPIIEIARYCPKLLHLSLNACKSITDRCISEIAQFCSNLKYINLAFSYSNCNISDVSVIEIPYAQLQLAAQICKVIFLKDVIRLPTNQ
ncbi:hypothetical protein Glove_374g29 [Diversispora epigaea]|uniref:HIRAN domain-containing protein n=1 Tax=Diversispora epigaea TaxID=1348612 RepID=A0A397H5I8_9GLOM|nr:hypothetical protein Glove_374g29 [Diversispora epigaea]